MRPEIVPQIRLYQDWLARERGLTFASYDALWHWSVTDVPAFWQSIWDFYDLKSPTPHSAVLVEPLGSDGLPSMITAQWFPGAKVNYAHQVFRHVDAAHAAGMAAITSHDESSLGVASARTLSWPALRQQVAALALHLQAHGVQPGDRVAAYLPNIPEAIVAFLATVSIGGVWSICAPDMGTQAVLDRFRQIEPKVLIACDGVRYGGRDLERLDEVAVLRAGLPTVQHLILHRILGLDVDTTKVIANYLYFTWENIKNDAQTATFEPLWVPFDHPLWIVYSSGTTGLPKPIVHGHGGTVIVALMGQGLHNDLASSYGTYPATETRRPKQGTVPEGLSAAAPILPAQDWTARRAVASGIGTSRELHAVSDRGDEFSRRAAPRENATPSGGRELHAVSDRGGNFGERFHWYSSTGWVMWNAQMNGLLFGTTCCIFDGNPAGRTVDAAGNKLAPDWTTLYRFAAEVGVTFFGAGAAFFANCMKSGIDLSAIAGLENVRALGTTGSPLSAEVQSWGSNQFAKVANRGGDEFSRRAAPRENATPSGGRELHEVSDRGGDIWWANISGGTDFAGAFIAGNRELPQVPGEMQCRVLGCAVEAWNEQGEPVVDEVGELVCTRPLPSMPLYFWGDEGHRRYLSSYFDTYPGKNGKGAPWRHGDWLKINSGNGGCTIYGRSDATINRHGLRMGTSEIYSAVEALPEVLDSMVVDLEYLGRDSYMPLFVVLREGIAFDDALRSKLNQAIKTALSPRFLPNDIFQVAEIPRTLSGKKQELPIKKLLLGHPLEKVINREAMANPACLDWYIKFAYQRTLTT